MPCTKPVSNSEPWLPTRCTSAGIRDNVARSRSARPDISAAAVDGNAASSRSAAADSVKRARVVGIGDDRGHGAVVVAGHQQPRNPRDRAERAPEF